MNTARRDFMRKRILPATLRDIIYLPYGIAMWLVVVALFA